MVPLSLSLVVQVLTLLQKLESVLIVVTLACNCFGVLVATIHIGYFDCHCNLMYLAPVPWLVDMRPIKDERTFELFLRWSSFLGTVSTFASRHFELPPLLRDQVGNCEHSARALPPCLD